MTGRVPVLSAAFCLLFPHAAGPVTAHQRTSDRAPEPAAVQARFEIEVDGVMAPVTARIRLSCVGAGGGEVTHVLQFGSSGDFDLSEPAPIDVTQTFRETTEVRALCRAGDGRVNRLPPRTVLVVDAASQRDSVIRLSNTARAEAGVGRLSPDTALDAVARAHARDMAERGYFDHVTPEGMDLAQRLKASGVPFAAAGENIGGNAGAGGVVRAWLASAGHRRNLLNPDFSRIGVGIYRMESSPYTYYVQVLAR